MVYGVEGSLNRRWRVRLVTATFLIAAGLPWVTVLLEQFPGSRPLAEGLRYLYGFQCHQRSLRSFSWLGAALPVCARCTGIYFGLGLAGWVGRPRLRPDPYKAWLLVGAMVVFLDVATEYVGLRPPSTTLRFLTGAFLSYGIALFLLSVLKR
jgi:uncharacterized membrane protein